MRKEARSWAEDPRDGHVDLFAAAWAELKVRGGGGVAEHGVGAGGEDRSPPLGRARGDGVDAAVVDATIA